MPKGLRTVLPEVKSMTVELRPLGVKCNIQCQYCYQNPQRDAGNVAQTYDMDKMKVAIEKEGGPFTVFGGEGLLVPEKDLENLWAWGLEKFGRNSLQSNGTLLTENHLRLFKQYNVKVGISVDGPGELNDIRWSGSLERTRELTAKTHAAIERLCQEGRPPGIIITLHRGNATRDKLPLMHDWIRNLQALGVTSVRLHLLEVDNEEVRRKYALTPEENREAMMSFLHLEEELTTLRFDEFNDMRHLLTGKDDDVTCVWNACDSYTTRAVRGVEGHGQRSNCGRTNKDGIDFSKANTEGYERYLALYNTPQEHGGCRGCRFFLMCKGYCPGTALDGDWRNRTEHCEVLMELYEHVEGQLVAQGETPLSQSPLREEVEKGMLAAWETGCNPRVSTVLQQLQPEPGAAEMV
jgi:uncharacterized protein